jgi:GxxExxY protein
MTQMDSDGFSPDLDALPGRSSTSEARDAQTFAIIGAAMEVHSQVGSGFLEPVYQEALAIELSASKVPHAREVPIPVLYKGVRLACGYRADFVCYGEVLVELKAVKKITNVEIAQLVNYLKATGMKRGLLLNFGADRLDFKRVIA